MPEYNEIEWRHVEDTRVIPITERHMCDLWVSCTEAVQVFGVREGKKTLLKAGTEFRFRAQVKGYEALEVTGKVPFGLKAITSPLQVGEYNSGERPPVVSMPEPSNLLQRMRQIARAHHEMSRMPVLEPDDFPSFGRYEIEDDDDEVLFEEEAHERRVEKARAKQKELAQAKKKQEAQAADVKDREPKPPAPSDKGAEAPKGGSAVPPPPKGEMAAE